MLVGALAGVAGAYYLKSLVLAVLITIIVGALMGLVVSYLTVSRRTNQVVTGLMINMLCLGATDMLFSMMSETRTNRCETFPIIFPEFMQNIPVIGKILEVKRNEWERYNRAEDKNEFEHACYFERV